MAFRPLIPLVDYIVNYDYIATELCENRAEPEILCNGKCYLAKEISKTTDETPKQNGGKTISVKLAELFINHQKVEIPLNFLEEFSFTEIHHYENSYEFLFSERLVKPPII